VTKKWGEKTREKFFQKHTHIASYKRWKKNRLEKVQNNVFYKHLNIVTKNGGKKREKKIFSRNTQISQSNNDGKKKVLKKCENTIFKNT